MGETDQPFATDRVTSMPACRRVLHVTTAHCADDVRIFERECRSLAASGLYEVYLAACGSIPGGSGVSLIPLTRQPRTRSGRFTSGPRKALGLIWAVDADLWHFHDPELLPVAVVLARSGHRVVWDAHEDYDAQFTPEGAKSWVPASMRKLVRLGTRAMLGAIDKHASAVFAATPTIAARYANDRTFVVGNEARLELFAECQPDFGSRTALFTGSPRPGHLFLEVVEAVAQVAGLSLVVAGRDPDDAVWRKAEKVLGERLKHVGWLDRAGIRDAINSCSVGFSTYADIRTNADNSPNKLYEFAAAGLPVVATPTRSNDRYMTASSAGTLADGFTSQELARALHALLSDERRWKAASDAGREWAFREGSWQRSEQRLLEAYAAVLSE